MVRPDAVRRLLGVLLDNLSDLHRYERKYPVVDYDRVHGALGDLSDLEAFAAFIRSRLDVTPP